MANFVFNIAKGRVNEFCERTNNNDPATAGFVIVLLQVAEAQATLEDYDDLAALLAGANTEALATDYVRKIITDAETAGMVIDDTGNTNSADFDDITWTALGNGVNTAIVSLIVCYAPDTGGADSTLIPCTHHDFAVTPDNSDVTAQLPAGGFFTAS